jgi:predicted XRE-type DNA-binding protein
MRTRIAKPKKVKIERGSGNVFADLGFPDAEERLAKANLAHRICSIIEASGLTQVQAAKRLGVDQPKVSMLIRGRLKDFSTERLLHFLVLLGRDVVIDIRDPEDRKHPSMRVLAEA